MLTLLQVLLLGRIVTARGQGYAYVAAWYAASLVWERWTVSSTARLLPPSRPPQGILTAANDGSEGDDDALVEGAVDSPVTSAGGGEALQVPCGTVGRSLRRVLFERGLQRHSGDLIAEVVGQENVKAVTVKRTVRTRGAVLRVQPGDVQRWLQPEGL